MWSIRYNAEKSLITIGPYIWAFTHTRTDDDYDYDDYGPVIVAYRQFVLHIGRLHVTVEWRLR